MAMPGWYDIVCSCEWFQYLFLLITFEKSFDDEGRSDDEPGITRSRDYLNNMLETESKETGVPISRMILGMPLISLQSSHSDCPQVVSPRVVRYPYSPL